MEDRKLGTDIGNAVVTVERVAKALYDALERDNPSATIGGWEFGAPIVLDGRFNLTAVALRLMTELSA